MKARVKHNNEIIDVIQVGTKSHLYDLNNIEFIDTLEDYWTRLEHTYAGMAMQGMLSGWWSENIANISKSDREHFDILVFKANELARVLVEKLKEKEERK